MTSNFEPSILAFTYNDLQVLKPGKITDKGTFVEIKVDPYLIQATTDVRNISDRFLKNHGLNYFQYCSVFDDNTSNFLLTHPEFALKRASAKRRILSHFEKTQLDEQTYMFFWNDSLPEEDTNMARDFGIDNGLCFVERFEHHYNLIAFGAPVGKRMNNFYLNNIDKLWTFIKEFKDRGCDIIAKAEEKRFYVPDFHQDVNRNQLFIREGLSTTYQGITFKLSAQEINCLRLSAGGLTMRNIADHLELSPRTVETYLNRVKTKAGLSNKKDLIQLFHRKIALPFEKHNV